MSEVVKNLKICIIGAGIGGLTSALSLSKHGFKDIHIFEMASNLGFVGAGIQLAPNMARILDSLGVWAPIEKEAVVLDETSIRQGSSNQELGHVDLGYIQKQYKYPHMVGHRASLVDAIFQGCKEDDNIHFHFSTTVDKLDFDSAKPLFTAKPRDSEAYTVEADVLLAADGVKSSARVAMFEKLGVETSVEDTGSAAYRIMLTREQMSTEPELLDLINQNKVTRWIGERRHLIAYPVSNKEIYNISTAQPDTNFAAAPSATYTTKGSKKAMLEVYSTFCPSVQKMLQLVPEGEVCEWKLRVHKRLPTWVLGCTALIGDACHPTLPHLAQGAAQAIEDAAVVGVTLARMKDRTSESIHKALKQYESVRKERAEKLVDLAAASGRALHLGEGKAKEERDKQFQASKDGKAPVPDKWADKDVQAEIYGFDCVQVAEVLIAGEETEVNG